MTIGAGYGSLQVKLLVFLDFHELIKIHYASSSIVDVFSQNFQNGLKCF